MESQNNERPLISEQTVNKLGDSLVSLAKSIGYPSIVAGLFYYLGLARVQAIYAYFGIDRNLLQLSMQDYIIKSIVASFEPIRWLLIVAIAGVWFNYWINNRIDKIPPAEDEQDKGKPNGVQKLIRIIVAAGILILLSGPLIYLIGISLNPFVYPTTWTLGVGLLTYAVYLALRLRKALEEKGYQDTWLTKLPDNILKTSTTLMMVMLIFSAFWFVSYYAQVIGNWEAGYLVSNIESMPCVEVYSQKPLTLQGEIVVEEEVSSEAEGYNYRYSGLRFLLFSAEKFFLLPVDYSRQNPRAIIVKDNESVRIEVSPGYYCTP